jgi:hypothetical protein
MYFCLRSLARHLQWVALVSLRSVSRQGNLMAAARAVAAMKYSPSGSFVIAFMHQ